MTFFDLSTVRDIILFHGWSHARRRVAARHASEDGQRYTRGVVP